ncbi:MAG: hypothetical protein WC455_12460 [Dehalococcoidia bacterium]|jgi:hypothetical protein
MALVWLGAKVTGRGMRGATEVILGNGYVADAVAICSLQMRFYHEFLQLKPIICTAGHITAEQQAELSSRVEDDFIFVFESKVSRSDFLATFKTNGTRHEPIGNIHFLVSPKDLCVDELPDWWGWLIPAGNGLTIKKMPRYIRQSNSTRDSIAHSLLWRIPNYEWELMYGRGKYLTPTGAKGEAE